MKASKTFILVAALVLAAAGSADAAAESPSGVVTITLVRWPFT